MVTINMPIPDACSECRLSVRHFGKLYCPPLNDRVGNEGKDSRCPLVDAEGRGDLISRQDALNCFHDWVDKRGDVHTADEMPEYQRIEQLPSAQPERKKGKWIYAEDEYGIDGYHCNQCGFFVPWDYTHKFINYIEDYHYCPHCGARMLKEGEEHEAD